MTVPIVPIVPIDPIDPIDQIAPIAPVYKERSNESMAVQQLPLDIHIMIIEQLELDDALDYCSAVQLPEALAYQYFDFYYDETVTNFTKLLKKYGLFYQWPTTSDHAKALYKNRKFQSIAEASGRIEVAIETLDMDLLHALLKDPELKTELNEDHLLDACWVGNADAVKLLVNEYGISPSHQKSATIYNAASKGHFYIVKFLISHPDFQTEGPCDALIEAIKENRFNIFQLLLGDARFDLNYNNGEPIYTAIELGRTEMLKLLLLDDRLKLSNLNKDYLMKTIAVAIQSKDYETVNLLLSDSRFDFLNRDQVGLVMAISYGEISLVKLFLSNTNLDPSFPNNRALNLAVASGKMDIVEYLLFDPRISSSGWYNDVIVEACASGMVDLIKKILSNPKFKVSALNAGGIVKAAENGHIDTVKLLLSDSRVDPSVQENQALISAIKKYHYEIAHLLVSDPRILYYWVGKNDILLKACENRQWKELIRYYNII